MPLLLFAAISCEPILKPDAGSKPAGCEARSLIPDPFVACAKPLSRSVPAE
jgi:hypothetical protein